MALDRSDQADRFLEFGIWASSVILVVKRAVLRRQFPGFRFYIKDERYKLKNLIQIQGFFFVFNLIRHHSPPDIAKKLECLEGNDVIRSVLFAGSPVVSLV